MEEELENIYDKVYSRLKNELKYFQEKYLEKSKEDIIANAYELTVRNEMVSLFEDCNYDVYEYKGLLEKDNILDFLYNDWINCDTGIHVPIRDNLNETMYELGEKVEEFEQDPNSKLITDMTNTFEELNNYSFCDEFMEANNIYVINKENIQKILNSKDGAKRLLNYFKEIKGNEQLLYLKEIQTINSESIDKIETEYIPKLNEIINKNKNKSKDIER